MSTKLPADVERRTTGSFSRLRLLVRRGFVENNVCLIHLVHAWLQLLNWPSFPQKKEKKKAVPLTDYKKREGGERKKKKKPRKTKCGKSGWTGACQSRGLMLSLI